MDSVLLLGSLLVLDGLLERVHSTFVCLPGEEQCEQPQDVPGSYPCVNGAPVPRLQAALGGTEGGVLFLMIEEYD